MTAQELQRAPISDVLKWLLTEPMIDEYDLRAILINLCSRLADS